MTGRRIDPDAALARAYGLRDAAEARALYAEWADSYDAAFAEAAGYVLPDAVARLLVAAGGGGPVLDVGAGTGLLGAALLARGVGPVDALDLSPEMLAVAQRKGIYRSLVAADVTRPVDLPAGSYAGIASSGTFTHGHVGPAALPNLVRLAAPGAVLALAVNRGVWDDMGFGPAFARLSDRLESPVLEEVPIYSPGAGGAHAGDRALVALSRRR